MKHTSENLSIDITATSSTCPAGETVGKRCLAEGKIPVLSCEGACIRGEIARQAANLIAKEEPYHRACHGELFAVPNSSIAQWVKQAEQVVLIDGCFIRCHGRILEHMIPKHRLIQYDALAHYNRYTDVCDIDAVPAAEREQTADDVANWVLSDLRERDAAR